MFVSKFPEHIRAYIEEERKYGGMYYPCNTRPFTMHGSPLMSNPGEKPYGEKPYTF